MPVVAINDSGKRQLTLESLEEKDLDIHSFNEYQLTASSVLRLQWRKTEMDMVFMESHPSGGE